MLLEYILKKVIKKDYLKEYCINNSNNLIEFDSNGFSNDLYNEYGLIFSKLLTLICIELNMDENVFDNKNWFYNIQKHKMIWEWLNQ